MRYYKLNHIHTLTLEYRQVDPAIIKGINENISLQNDKYLFIDNKSIHNCVFTSLFITTQV